MTNQDEVVDVPPMAIVKAERVQLGAIDLVPEEVIARGASIAKALAKVIRDRHLFNEIRGRAHVHVEGWTTLGAMLGIMPRERWVRLLKPDDSLTGDVGFEAYVELVRVSDGAIIGGASAVCTKAERNWQDRDEYAVRSMAITRATGKAFRLSLSWIIQLAGFDPTPAEEMPFFDAMEHKAAANPKVETTNLSSEESIGQSATSTPAGETGKTPTKTKDAVTLFWELVNKWALDKQQAQEVLDKHGGNFLNAYEALQASLERGE